MSIWNRGRTCRGELFSRPARITAAFATLLMLPGCSVIEHRIGHQTLNLYAADPAFVFKNPSSIRVEKTSDTTANGNGAESNGTGESNNGSANSEPTKNADGTSAPIYLNDLNIVVCPAPNSVTPSANAPPANAPPGNAASASAAPANAASADASAHPSSAGGSHPPKSTTAPSSGDASSQPKTPTPQVTAPSPAAIPTSVTTFGSTSASSGSSSSSCVLENAYQAAIADTSGGMRNRLEAILVGHSNLVCSQIEAQIVGTNDLINFTLGETTTILAGSGALVTGATAAKLLAGLAAMTNATRSQVDEIFYENELKAAIIQKINELRATALQNIKAASIDATSGEPVALTKFSTEDMLNAVENYHNLCSFYVGITSLTQPQAQTASSSDVAIKALAAQVKQLAAKIGTQGGAPPATP